MYIRALAVDFFTNHINMVAAWADRTIAEVETWDDLTPTKEKNEKGLEKIRQLPVDTPSEPLTEITRPPKSQTRKSIAP